MESEGPFPCLKSPATYPYPRPDQSSPCLPSHSLKSIVTLYSHPRPGLPSGLFPSGLSTKIRYAPILSHIPASCTALPTPLNLITRIILGEERQSLSSSLCSFLNSSVTISLLGQTIPFSGLFSKRSAYVPPSMSVPMFHTRTKQQAKLYFCTSKSSYFWITKWKSKDSAPNDSKHYHS